MKISSKRKKINEIKRNAKSAFKEDIENAIEVLIKAKKEENPYLGNKKDIMEIAYNEDQIIQDFKVGYPGCTEEVFQGILVIIYNKPEFGKILEDREFTLCNYDYHFNISLIQGEGKEDFFQRFGSEKCNEYMTKILLTGVVGLVLLFIFIIARQSIYGSLLYGCDKAIFLLLIIIGYFNIKNIYNYYCYKSIFS